MASFACARVSGTIATASLLSHTRGMRTRSPGWRSGAPVLCGLSSLLLYMAVAQAQQPAPVTLRRESGNLVLEGIPPRDAALSERLARYLNSRSASFLDWMPDGSLLISTRFGDADQLHRVEQPGGSREQLTFFPEPITSAAVPQTANAEG